MLLATPRPALRAFHEADAPTLAAYRSDPDIARYQSWEIPVTVESATAFIRDVQHADPREPGWFQHAVERSADQTLIGDVGVNLHDNRMQAEIVNGPTTCSSAYWPTIGDPPAGNRRPHPPQSRHSTRGLGGPGGRSDDSGADQFEQPGRPGPPNAR